MIKKQNVKELLELMHYSTNGDNIYVKSFEHSSSIMVDIKSEEIFYPNELKVNDKTTSNFEHPENFVVLECVTRLLEKGYLARNLELEPRWQLGRGASGGKADILVKDNNSHEFLIIECKTFGDEFDKAWQKTLIDGDQLFSYAQQIKKTQYLCLYASNIDNNKIVYTDRIMTLKDNEDYLKTLKISKRLKYKDASDVKELYRVWKEIYNLEYEETGIFEDGITPYEINKVYSIKDLKSVGFEDTQKKYNEFATILRQHNVSGHENAFDKLINIFLAKIVDEIQHPNNLKFNWKGIAFDDYYQLQDRLQKLYKDGMQKFLNEEVTYIDNKQILDTFKLFKNDPDATKDKVMEYFRELKFFTNNDFAFIDVHNEELFKQNSEILLKMVKMFQDIKLKTEEQNQFLGDLFEGFLDDGIKQSEGQFFTPLPITRFIVSSLPLKEIIEENDNYPKVIDYACGAGHFLNEYASQVKRFFSTEEELQNCYSEIDGIEKEYRLSKVSKVSAFMYGQDSINITYGDALADNKNIKDGQYDILIANPPYSVKGFLETLTEDERNKYQLTKLVNKNAYSTNNSIETFFVERAKQLLKPGGVAGIVLPASLLTNGSNLYTTAREIILQYFDIISIVELPSGTFGATGTNTVILFLRKKDDNPSLAEHYKNRVNSWFNGNFEKDKVFDDKDILLEYLNLHNIEYDDYMELLNKHTINDNLKENDMIKSYLNDSKVKTINKILEVEKDKLYYYMLASSQKNDVVIVNAPSSKEEIKRYLGYEWSNRKGSEGIKYIGTNTNGNDDTLSKNKGIEKIVTPLFNQNDFYDESKINSIIRNKFNNVSIKSDYDNIQHYNLVDLLDFNANIFTKSIKVNNIIRHINIKPGFKLYSLSDNEKFDLSIGKRVLSTDLKENGHIPVFSANVNEIFGYMDSTLNSLNSFEIPSILWGIDGDWNVNIIEKNIPFYPTDHCGVLRIKDENINNKYMMYALYNEGLKSKFSRSNRASTQRVKDLMIQVPSKLEQEDVVEKLNEINQKILTCKNKIADIKSRINNYFREILLKEQTSNVMIKNLSKSITAGGDTPLDITNDKNGEYIYPVYSNGTLKKGLLGYSKNYKINVPSITISARGTIGYTEIRNEKYTPAVRLITLIPNENVDINYLKYAIDNLDIKKTGNGAGQLTVPDFEKMIVPILNIEIQKEFSKNVEEKNKEITKLEREIERFNDEFNKTLKMYFN